VVAANEFAAPHLERPSGHAADSAVIYSGLHWASGWRSCQAAT
jgi:membrane-associated phospholipid phosphatase